MLAEAKLIAEEEKSAAINTKEYEEEKRMVSVKSKEVKEEPKEKTKFVKPEPRLNSNFKTVSATLVDPKPLEKDEELNEKITRKKSSKKSPKKLTINLISQNYPNKFRPFVQLLSSTVEQIKMLNVNL